MKLSCDFVSGQMATFATAIKIRGTYGLLRWRAVYFFMTYLATLVVCSFEVLETSGLKFNPKPLLCREY